MRLWVSLAMAQVPDEALIKKVVDRLRELREQTGMSQLDVLHATGVHVGRIEANSYNVTISTLARLCACYDITVSELMKSIGE